MDYGVYRPRTRLLERSLVYAMLGLTDVNETPVVWPRSYRRVATVSARTPEEAALQGEVLMGDVLLPPVGPALLSQGDDAFLPLLRSLPRRPS